MTLAEPDTRSGAVTSQLGPPEPRRERGGAGPLGPSSRWRLAARIARRESFRRPGRTALVMLLVLVPVLAMTIGIVTARSQVRTDDERWAQQFGTADAVLEGGANFGRSDLPQSEMMTLDEVELPEGSTVVEYASVFSSIEGSSIPDDFSVVFSDVPLDVPATASMFDIVDGRAPVGFGEVALGREVADRTGLAVGDVLDVTDPALSFDVVGVVDDIDQLNARLVVVGELDRDRVRPGSLRVTRLVEFAPDVDPVVAGRELTRFNDRSDAAFFVQTQEQLRLWGAPGDALEAEVLLIAWAAAVVVFVGLGIVVAAAFAVSARRQLVTIGQLAANGAPRRLIRRVLAAQGTVTAFAAALVGIVVGVALTLVGESVIERFTNRRIDGIVVRPLDLLVIAATATLAGTVAALVPARSASRTSVLAALAGRRPVSVPPRWMAPTGLALFGGGWLVLLGVVTTEVTSESSSTFVVLAAILGGLGILFGMVCCSPFVVHAIGWFADRLRGSARLAARSLARTRGRSAAIVTSIATVMAIGTGALTAVGNIDENRQRQGDGGLYGPNTVHLTFQREIFDAEPVTSFDPTSGRPIREVRDDQPLVDLLTPTPRPAEIVDVVESVVGDVAPLSVRTAGIVDLQSGDRVAIADEALVDFLDLDDETRELLADDVVVGVVPWATQPVAVATSSGEIVDLAVVSTAPTDAVESLTESESLASGLGVEKLINEDFAADLDLVTGVTRLYYELDRSVTAEEREQIERLDPWAVDRSGFLAAGETAEDVTFDRDPTPERFLDGFWSVYAPRADDGTSPLLLAGVTLAVVLALTLLVVAIGLSLAATESREERAVLLATGASPATLRRLAAVKAVLLTAAAAVIAVPTSFVVVTTLFRVNDEPSPVPWLGMGLLGIAVPVVVGLATLVVSEIASRVRPTTTAHLART